jgi:hypothetical protein
MGFSWAIHFFIITLYHWFASGWNNSSVPPPERVYDFRYFKFPIQVKLSVVPPHRLKDKVVCDTYDTDCCLYHTGDERYVYALIPGKIERPDQYLNVCFPSMQSYILFAKGDGEVFPEGSFIL